MLGSMWLRASTITSILLSRIAALVSRASVAWTGDRGGHSASGRQVVLAPCGLLITIMSVCVAAGVTAQAPADSSPRRYRIVVTVDSTSSPNAWHRYFFHPRDSLLRASFGGVMSRWLGERLSSSGDLAATVVEDSSATHAVRCEIGMDSDGAFRLRVSIDPLGPGGLDSLPPLSGALPRVVFAKKNGPLSRLADSSVSGTGEIIDELAQRLVTEVRDDVYRRITEKIFRIRVLVGQFAQLRSDTGAPALDSLLRWAVEGELRRSDAIQVMVSNQGSPPANYHVNGGYAVLGGELRIDIRCIRADENRLLTTRHLVVDSVDATHLSNSITELVAPLRHAIEVDHQTDRRALAVAATVEPSRFNLQPAGGRSRAIARELTRATLQKLRLLATGGEGARVLNLDVFADLEGITATAGSEPSPSEILAELDADYLLLLTYQDLGDRVRVTADLHTFDAQRPAVGSFVYERLSDVSDLDRTVDSVVVRVTRMLLAAGFASHPGVSTIVEDSTLTILSQVRVRDLTRGRHFAFGIGVPFGRASPALFLDRSSGFVFQGRYATHPGFLRVGRPGGQFDLGVEIGLSVETTSLVGGIFSANGPAGAVTSVALTWSLTNWEYARTAVNVTLGAVGGVYGLRYNLRPGDLDYVGTDPYRETQFSPVVGGFLASAFPLIGPLGFEVRLTSLWGTRTITGFTDLPLARFADTSGPTGHVGGQYLTASLGYRF